ATDSEHRLLRGKAMECATFIAMAVGKDVFAPDIPRFVELLTAAQHAVVDADDPQASYLQAAWARLCGVMGADFAPLLSVVMPALLVAARLQPEVTVLSADEDAEESYAAEDGWEFSSIGGQQVGIKTTTLEEKCTAVELLSSYARDLGAGFQPYALEVLEVVVPLFKFYFHEGVRAAAAAAVPAVLQTVAAGGSAPALQQAWAAISERYVAVLGSEEDDTFTMQLFASFAEAVETVGPQALAAPQLQAFAAACVEQMTKYHTRMKEREAARAADELDDDDEEQLAEDELVEGLAVDEVAKALHAVFRSHGAAFVDDFRSILPVALKFLHERDPAARQWAICVFDDLVEFAGASSDQYASEFLGPIATALAERAAPDLRQAAAYGVGVMAQFGGDAYADFVARVALPVLLAEVQRSDARAQENVYATENAVAAIAKVLRFAASRVADAQRVLCAWFAALPVCNDEDEAPAAYEFLLHVLREQPDAVLGPGNSDAQALRHLVKVVAEALAACNFAPELAQALVSVVQSTLAAFDDAAKAALWAEIPREQQDALQTKGFF
ncbi:importin subunit beta-3, partial [Coemansia sp. RSA 2322]